MNPSRRAAHAWADVLLTTAVVLSTSALVAGAAAVAVATRMARRVVTPAPREKDTTLLDVDLPSQTITLSRTPDTELPGRYGLFTTGSQSYLKLGAVLAEDEGSVTRKLLTQLGADDRLDAAAAFNGWYFDDPAQLQLPFSNELVGTSVGPCPAWVFPAEDPGDLWVVQVHGRGATRAECLRAVPVFRAEGISTLIVSYRNDGQAPRSRRGGYGLGATEWRDVDAAIGVAVRHGARRVILMGWSMGGAIVLQVALRSAHRELIRGIVLDSPVVDWRLVLDYQAKQARVPAPVARLAVAGLGSERASAITGTDAGIPFDRLDLVARADELNVPILILHSDDDGFVPSDASHRLAAERPDLVRLEVFTTARHTKLWNYDPERWEGAIRDWLRAQGLSAADD